LTIVNKSTNPYTIYKNGNILLTIPSKSEENIYVEMGTTLFKAEQKTGYLMYPTVNNRKVTFNAACQTLTINIGFTD
jgi:paraquat-inducible protein B